MFDPLGGEPFQCRSKRQQHVSWNFGLMLKNTEEGDAVKKYFAQLRPLERRHGRWRDGCIVHRVELGFLWPHFSDWGKLKSGGLRRGRSWSCYQTGDCAVAEIQGAGEKFAETGRSSRARRSGHQHDAHHPDRRPRKAASASSTPRAKSPHTNDVFSSSRCRTSMSSRPTRNWWIFFTSSAPAPRWCACCDLELRPDARAPASQRQHPARRQLPEKSRPPAI